jgi:hypothetical protein
MKQLLAIVFHATATLDNHPVGEDRKVLIKIGNT